MFGGCVPRTGEDRSRIENDAVGANGEQHVVQRSLERTSVEEVEVANLDRITNVGGQTGDEAAQHVDRIWPKRGRKLNRDWRHLVEAWFERGEEFADLCIDVAQLPFVCDRAMELEHEPEVGRNRLCPPGSDRGLRQRVERRITFDSSYQMGIGL